MLKQWVILGFLISVACSFSIEPTSETTNDNKKQLLTLQPLLESKLKDAYCNHSALSSHCCIDITNKFPEVSITVCLDAEYDFETKELSINVTWNGQNIRQWHYPGNSTDLKCDELPIEILGVQLKGCLHLSDINATETNYYACIHIVLMMTEFQILSDKIACFDLGSTKEIKKNSSIVTPQLASDKSDSNEDKAFDVSELNEAELTRQTLQQFREIKLKDASCNHSELSSDCCIDITNKFPEVSIRVCLDAEYDFETKELSINVTWNGQNIRQWHYPGNSTDLKCDELPIEILGVQLKGCFHLCDINATETNYYTCVDLVLMVAEFPILSDKIACFDLGSTNQIKNNGSIATPQLTSDKTDNSENNGFDVSELTEAKLTRHTCSYSNYSSHCCVDIKNKFPHISDTLCLDANYLFESKQLRMNVTWNGKKIMQWTVPGQSTEPQCLKLPIKLIGNLLDGCLSLSNINEDEDHYSACVHLQIRAGRWKLFSDQVGCFTLGPKDQDWSCSYDVQPRRIPRMPSCVNNCEEYFKRNVSKTDASATDEFSGVNMLRRYEKNGCHYLTRSGKEGEDSDFCILGCNPLGYTGKD